MVEVASEFQKELLFDTENGTKENIYFKEEDILIKEIITNQEAMFTIV